ncbi:MAG: M28 family peptidase [Longimicrobiales bacterium]|nr:M28 family peptidase [Longimicrobiales bacterium]
MARRLSRLLPLLLATTFFPLGLGAQTVLPRTRPPEPTVPGITVDDLMTRLYIFAADSMRGREAGTEGNVKGTDYLAAEAARIGLEPAGEDGTYFQTVPYKSRALAPESSIRVGGDALHLGDDFLPLGQGETDLKGVTPIFGGSLAGDGAGLTLEEAQGKLVVFLGGDNINLGALSRAAVPGAAAVAVVALDQIPPPFREFFTRPQGFVDDPEREAAESAPVLLLSEDATQRIFATPLDGLEAGAVGASVDLAIRYDVEPMPYPSRNVVAILPGSDPELRGEYVAIGAHNDHVGIEGEPVAHDSLRTFNRVVRPGGAEDGNRRATPAQQAEVNRLLAEYRAAHPGPVRMDSIANGADDDGSGSVTVLEIAEKLASMDPRPKRSILFVWHTGEEKGLLGAGYFTDHPTVPREAIVAQINMDMVGRGSADDQTGHTVEGEAMYGNPDYLLLVGSRRISTELGDLVESVNREKGHGLDFDYSFDVENHPSNIYGRSDHYEYARYGIPIVFFTTGLHSDYHQVTDEPQYIDYDHMTRIARFVGDVALEVADLDHRLVVDPPVTTGGAGGR